MHFRLARKLATPDHSKCNAKLYVSGMWRWCKMCCSDTQQQRLVPDISNHFSSGSSETINVIFASTSLYTTAWWFCGFRLKSKALQWR